MIKFTTYQMSKEENRKKDRKMGSQKGLSGGYSSGKIWNLKDGSPREDCN